MILHAVYSIQIKKNHEFVLIYLPFVYKPLDPIQ